MNKKLSLLLGISIYLLALSPLVIKAQTPTSTPTPTSTLTPIPINKSIYPKQNAVPTPDPSWLSLVDFSKVPKIPPRVQGASCDIADPTCYWPCYNCLRTNDTDISTCPKKSDWGMTYDDGPSAFTPALLTYLKSKNSKATFFVIGSNVLNFPEVLKQTAEDGHQIGVHTWSHTPLTTQTNEQIIAEIKWTEKAIKDVTGFTPLYMRPPAGDVDDRVRAIMKQLGYKIAMWDRDTFDWTSNLPGSTYDLNWIAGNFTQWVSETNKTTGDMSLEHDAFEQTAAKAPGAIDIVLSSGRTIKTVANCIGQTAFYKEDVNATTNTSNTNITSSQNSSSSITTIISNYNILIITFCVIISQSTFFISLL